MSLQLLIHVFKPDIHPLPLGVTCGFPGKPSNGAVSSAASSHAYNARVTYSCSAGWTLQGSRDNVCQNNGRWKNSVPTCRRTYSRSRITTYKMQKIFKFQSFYFCSSIEMSLPKLTTCATHSCGCSSSREQLPYNIFSHLNSKQKQCSAACCW